MPNLEQQRASDEFRQGGTSDEFRRRSERRVSPGFAPFGQRDQWDGVLRSGEGGSLWRGGTMATVSVLGREGEIAALTTDAPVFYRLPCVVDVGQVKPPR